MDDHHGRKYFIMDMLYIITSKGGGPIKELVQSFSCISSEIPEITEPIKELLQKKTS